MKCKKRKYDFLGAKLELAIAQSPAADNKRQECRMYFCRSCKFYHLTSKQKMKKLAIVNMAGGFKNHGAYQTG